MSADPPPQPNTLIDLASNLREQAIASSQRRVLVLSGDQTWCRRQVSTLIHNLPYTSSCWVGDPPPDGVISLKNPDVFGLLGSETEMLVYDAFAGFDPDAFGALSGTLIKGGLLILLTPRFEQWPNFPDPEHMRIAVAGYSAEEVTGRFLYRLAESIRLEPTITCVEQESSIPAPPLPVPMVIPPVAHDRDCRTDDQAHAVRAVLHVVSGHRHRPIVLISDRGRGKSAALGIAAARLLQSGRRKILVTAPRLAATQALFEQAKRLLRDASSSKGSLHLGAGIISYQAPDHLLQQPQPADLLMVDEAAAIPTPLLEGLLDHYPRIAFATTIHGYEGTGMGFNVRFRQVLNRRFPSWREVRLHTPVRWADNDPLERWLFSALALDAAPAADELISEAAPDNCSFERLDPDHLASNEGDLRELFGLLVLAHYRTTPFDLRQMLDGPNLSLYCLRHQGHIVAIALLAREGGFDAPTAQAIWAGDRRPQGHLLAQSLAAHLGLVSGATLLGARIMRIAVHPHLQRRNLGSQLVRTVIQQAESAGLDYLGASFGATPELIDFWDGLGLTPVRIGLRRGASSGTQSVMMLHPLTLRGEELHKLTRQRFARQFPPLLSDALNDLEPALACSLLARMQSTGDLTSDPQDWLDLIGFAFARRGYDVCLPAIESLTLRALYDSRPVHDDAQLLVMKVLQHRSWQDCAKRFELSGRSGVECRLREVIGELLLDYADQTTHEEALRVRSARQE